MRRYDALRDLYIGVQGLGWTEGPSAISFKEFHFDLFTRNPRFVPFLVWAVLGHAWH